MGRESPDIGVAPAVGWRCWRLSLSSGHLHSTVWGTVWTPYRRMEATYYGDETRESRVCSGSSVGFHAWRRRSDLDRIIKFDDGFVPVWGEVSLWGRIVECTDGWRGEFAYPLSFLLLSHHREHAARLAGTYGVEARVMV